MPIKKIAFFLFLLISFFVINSLIHSITVMWQKDQFISFAKQELENEKKKNQELKKQLVVVKRPQFVEEEARDKLFMVKSGENVIIIPSVSPIQQLTVNKQQSTTKPKWQQWWELFF